ncbi:GGDEF domain-containing protein [Bacillaceae bacterium W0354]
MIFKKRKPLRTNFLKLFAIFDLLFIYTLIVMTGGWTSLFTLFIFLMLINISITYKGLGQVVLLILVLVSYVGLGILLENDLSSNIIYISFYLIMLILIFIMMSVITRKNDEEIMIPKPFNNQTLIDPVTGLYNHRSFHNTLSKFASMDKPFALIMGDLEQFKQINAKYGYAVGDHVLSTFGHSLLYFQKEQNYYSFRYGTDQFFIILFETKERHVLNYIHLWNNLFEDSLNQILELEHEQVKLNYGITIKRAIEEKEILIKRAEQALLQAKQRKDHIYFSQREEEE